VHIITLHTQTHTRARAYTIHTYITSVHYVHTYIMISTTLYFFNVSNVQPSRMDLFVLCVFMCMCIQA